jgi:heme/copper-type cytochrome/quinol oxidase subunit 2
MSLRPLLFPVCAGWMLLLDATPALACSACFGQSDSPLARGMNWGILSLLAVVTAVLGWLVALFVFMARRARQRAGCLEPPAEP